MAKFVHKPTPPVESVSLPTPKPEPVKPEEEIAGLLPGETIVPSIDEFEIDPEVEKALPWGPPEAYKSKRSGRWMYIRRSSHIMGSLGGFWEYYRKRKEFLKEHGVRLTPVRNMDGTPKMDGRHKIWDATWYLPRKGKAGKGIDPRVDPDAMIAKPTEHITDFHLRPKPNVVRELMKRLATTKASAWPEYAAVQRMLDVLDSELEDIE